MRQLKRGPAPDELEKYRHGRDTWDALSSKHKEAIWGALDLMQGELCAYCECRLEADRRHIEHFCPRSRWPQGTFTWSNLLGSCNRSDSCGHFKDSSAAPPYECRELVDPVNDDPDDFFIIRDTGRIDARHTLSASDAARAELSLRVFNLNLDEGRGGRSLCAARARVLEFYLRRERGVLEALSDLSPEERAACIEAELEGAAAQPFSSILRHFFERAH